MCYAIWNFQSVWTHRLYGRNASTQVKVLSSHATVKNEKSDVFPSKETLTEASAI